MATATIKAGQIIRLGYPGNTAPESLRGVVGSRRLMQCAGALNGLLLTAVDGRYVGRKILGTWAPHTVHPTIGLDLSRPLGRDRGVLTPRHRGGTWQFGEEQELTVQWDER